MNWGLRPVAQNKKIKRKRARSNERNLLASTTLFFFFHYYYCYILGNEVWINNDDGRSNGIALPSVRRAARCTAWWWAFLFLFLLSTSSKTLRASNLTDGRAFFYIYQIWEDVPSPFPIVCCLELSTKFACLLSKVKPKITDPFYAI